MNTPLKKNWQVIKCPHCGYEYVPGEVFYPEDLLGKPESIIRDALGKILYVEYAELDDEPCFEEHFVCDHCEKQFIVSAIVSYKSKEEDEELDFASEYVSLLD